MPLGPKATIICLSPDIHGGVRKIIGGTGSVLQYQWHCAGGHGADRHGDRGDPA